MQLDLCNMSLPKTYQAAYFKKARNDATRCSFEHVKNGTTDKCFEWKIIEITKAKVFIEKK